MDVEKFITEVQNHSVLYDTSHAFYKDNTRKEKAWSEVAAALGCSANYCKSRWRLLRDSFVKNKKKSSLSSGSAGQKDWKYAELMSFLLPFIWPRSSKSKLGPMLASGAEEAGEGERWEIPLSVESRPPSPIPNLSMPPTSAEVQKVARFCTSRERAQHPGQETRRKTTQVSYVEDRLLKVLEEPPHKSDVPNSVQDEAYHFALSTVPMLLNLSTTRRRRAKREILKVLDLLTEEEEGEQVAASQLVPMETQSPSPTDSTTS